MPNGDLAVSRGSHLPRRVAGSSDIERAGKRTSSASTAFWRRCNAGRPRRSARGGGQDGSAETWGCHEGGRHADGDGKGTGHAAQRSRGQGQAIVQSGPAAGGQGIPGTSP